jgi:formylglycine-generating enzyme required for sulfatase activity
MKTVFISYSQKDKEVAAKIKARLQEHDIVVTIDSESLPVGGDIRTFIDKSIRETHVTLSIVSWNSLTSDWVALESIESFNAENFLGLKQFIPCFIDEEFKKEDCLIEAAQLIDKDIVELDKKIVKAMNLKIDPVDLQSIRTRKVELRNNLSKILKRLRESWTIDIREPVFDKNLEKIINHINLDSERESDHRYLDWLRTERIKELKYTKLSGRTQRRVELRNLFRRLPSDKIGIGDTFAFAERKDQLEPFLDAVAEILTLRRAVLLGDPGSGKSTTLWKLAEKLCEESARDPKKPLPVLVRLGFWTSANESLKDFINLQNRPLPAPIDQLLSEKRVAILLDGMNEIPTGQWKAKYEEIREFITAHQDLIVVVSCRELDYTVDLKLNRIVILPLDPIRIRHFVDTYLGAGRGESLFWKLPGPDAFEIFALFSKQIGSTIDNPDRTFWLERQLPQRALFSSWQWNRWLDIRDSPGSLLVLSRNPFMLSMICEIYEATDTLPENKGKLFGQFVTVLIQREIDSKRALPEEMELLIGALSKLAYEMQINPSKLTTIEATMDPEEDEEEDDVDEDHDDPDSSEDSSPESDRALTSLQAERVRELIGARLLELALSANLLSGDEEIRFAHQLLQEYFTAIYMEEEISSDRLKATQIWPAESWWERTNWEVATRLLAGLHTDDCSKVVNWVAEANPEVAAECIVLSGAALAPATKKKLRKEWRTRLVDPARDPDPRARAAVGRALGLTGWDNRDGIGTKKVEIDGEMIALPDFDKAWVEIPAGEFTSGPLIEFDFNKGGYLDSPMREVTLPSFKISRYPVTFVQFQTFVDDPEGYQNQDRWFEGLAASEDDRRLEDQYFRIDGKAYSNDPRESVNWYQSVAFCRWLSWRFGGGYDLKKIDEWIVRLPTELEWERAARGLDGRIYPYGNEFDSTKGNTSETGIGRTSAVGIFPDGASPDGVLDMSGNVWQWCLHSSKSSEFDLAQIDLTTKNVQPQRGGSWLFHQGFARAVFRFGYHPLFRNHGVGFRVVSVVRPPS